MPEAVDILKRDDLLAALPGAKAEAEITLQCADKRQSYYAYVQRAVDMFRVLTAEELGRQFDALRAAKNFVGDLEGQRIGREKFQQACDAVLDAYGFRVLNSTLSHGLKNGDSFRDVMGGLDTSAYCLCRALQVSLGSVVCTGFEQILRQNGCDGSSTSSLSVISGPAVDDRTNALDPIARQAELAKAHWYISVRWDHYYIDRDAKLRELRAAVVCSGLQGVTCVDQTGGMSATVPVAESRRLFLGV